MVSGDLFQSEMHQLSVYLNVCLNHVVIIIIIMDKSY